MAEAVGVAGLKPAEFWELTWPDYDDLLYYHYRQEQQQLVGHRLTATHLYNLGQGFAKHPRFQSPRQHFPLPLIDAPEVDNTPPAGWWEKMQALAAASGKRFAGTTD